jgi:hypothetical protein
MDNLPPMSDILTTKAQDTLSRAPDPRDLVTRWHFEYAIALLAVSLGRSDIPNLYNEVMIEANAHPSNPNRGE